MGIIKFIITFIFFYYAIKIIRSVFFVTKTIRNAKQAHQNTMNSGPRNSATSKEDIIDADYKVVDED